MKEIQDIYLVKSCLARTGGAGSPSAEFNRVSKTQTYNSNVENLKRT